MNDSIIIFNKIITLPSHRSPYLAASLNLVQKSNIPLFTVMFFF